MSCVVLCPNPTELIDHKLILHTKFLTEVISIHRELEVTVLQKIAADLLDAIPIVIVLDLRKRVNVGNSANLNVDRKSITICFPDELKKYRRCNRDDVDFVSDEELKTLDDLKTSSCKCMLRTIRSNRVERVVDLDTNVMCSLDELCKLIIRDVWKPEGRASCKLRVGSARTIELRDNRLTGILLIERLDSVDH